MRCDKEKSFLLLTSSTPYLSIYLLEQPAYFAGIHIDIHPSESRVRTGSGHQADGPGHGAKESCATEDEDIPNWKDPTFWHSLLGGVVGQAEVGLDHHGIKVL